MREEQQPDREGRLPGEVVETYRQPLPGEVVERYTRPCPAGERGLLCPGPAGGRGCGSSPSA